MVQPRAPEIPTIVGAPKWATGFYWQHTQSSYEGTRQVESWVVSTHREAAKEQAVLFSAYWESERELIPGLSLIPYGIVPTPAPHQSLALEFPLEVGKEARRKVQAPPPETGTVTFLARVVEHGSIGLSWGRVEALRIQLLREGEPWGEFWYSPLAQTYVFWKDPRGTIALERVWQFPETISLDLMFQRLEQGAARDRVATIRVLKQLVQLNIARQRAQEMLDRLL